jgi:GTP-binding protein Era
MSTEPSTRFGTIVLAGKPNAGKSTLLNAMVGQKLAIVSPKPQSTRSPVMGLVSDASSQLLFVDPPGLLEPSGIMQQSMLDCAVDALEAANAVLLLHPVTEGPPPSIQSLVPDFRFASRPVATVLTKADMLPVGSWPTVTPPEFLVSAETGEGISDLIAWCRNQAPPGEFRYDADDIGTQPLRFFVAELVRESAFEALDQELPYAMAALVEEFREDRKPVYIRVTLYVERASQKGMVIGKGGATIKAIGAASRAKVEELIGERVYLDLWVKVLAKWRKSPKMLRMFGLPVTPKKEKRNS